MREQASYLSERLRQEWQFRREMVNYYFGICCVSPLMTTMRINGGEN